MSEPKDSTSPFSILLAEAGGEPPRPDAKRTQGIVAPQRSDTARNTQRSDAESSQQTDEDAAADAPDACATETAAMEQPDAAAASFEIAVAGQAAVTPEASPPGESNGDATDEEIAAVDAALATAVETPAAAVPAQPVAPDAPPPAVAVTPAAAAPTDPGMVESTAAAGVTAAAPTGNSAPATPDAALDAAEPAPAQATQAPQVQQAPQAQQSSEQAAQPPAVPAAAEAKPPVEPTATTETAASESAASASATETPEAVTPAASASNQEPTDNKPAPKQPAQADAPPQHAVRSHGPDAPERPQNASAVSDFVQAAHQQTPDGSQFAQLHAGRDFGQAVAAAAHAMQSAAAPDPLMSAPVPLESLAVEIAARAQGGSNRFEIRLDPPELGRIDVRLDIDRSGNVTSRLVVEKAETLDALRRDAHQLERALQDAGLKTSDNGLQFSLRDQSSAGRDDRNGDNNPRLLIADPELAVPEGATAAYGLTLRGGSGIDIRV